MQLLDELKEARADREGERMFGIGMPELIIILVIIMIIFGAGKLPDIGAGVGKAIRNFKSATIETDKKQVDKIEEVNRVDKIEEVNKVNKS